MQMTQEKIADSWIEIEMFRLLVLRTAWLIDEHNDYKRVRIGIAVSVLPLSHPIRLAEELAMIDMISKGRLVSGFVRWADLEAEAPVEIRPLA